MGHHVYLTHPGRVYFDVRRISSDRYIDNSVQDESGLATDIDLTPAFAFYDDVEPVAMAINTQATFFWSSHPVCALR